MAVQDENPNTVEHLMISFNHAQNLVEFSDSKANILLVIHTLVLTIATGSFSIIYINTSLPLKWTSILGIVSFVIFIIVSAISLLFAVYVIYPRDAIDNKSLFYYITIAELGKDEYLKRIMQLTETELIDGLAHQSYNISKIARKKMDNVRRSSYLIIIYLIALTIAVILSLIGALG